MGHSNRTLLLNEDDTLLRLAEIDFGRLYQSDGAWRVGAFSAQSIRMASLLVEMQDRRPTRVVGSSFSFLHFDDSGQLDVARFNRDQVARVDAHVGSTLAGRSGAKVVEAASQFAARGGKWQPNAELLARLQAAALGRVHCSCVKLERLLTDPKPCGES